MRRYRVLVFLASFVLGALVVPVIAARPSSGAVAGSQADASSVQTDEVCFTVHNEGDPVGSDVYGVRYYVGEPRPETNVIVLVHGHSVTHAFWDVHPDFSIARSLAEAGYVVIAYDRLGYGKSPYQRPRGAGFTLTLSSQRVMLHEIVTQVKSGSYRFSGDGSCKTGSSAVVGLASSAVILIGDSNGGAIVSGYPGTYHDVAAAVPAGWNNQGLTPEATAYVTQTLGPEYAKGNDYATLFPTEEGCKATLLYLPEVVPSLLPTVCRSGFVAAPGGEVAGIARTYADNRAAIPRVGRGVPVLLVFQDRDFFFPSDKNREEVRYWTTHCGCDVESWTQHGSGHALHAHRSMPTFTSKVVTWLASRGLGGPERPQ